MNPLYLFGNTNTSWSSNITLSNGKLTGNWTSGSGSNQHARSNFAMLSGKWYFEGRMSATSGGDFGVLILSKNTLMILLVGVLIN